MTLPELVIDLREEHELLEKKLVSNGNSNRYEIVNIPSRHIFANVDWIKKQTEKRPVWLICASGRRSQAIKDQYFATNDGIKSSVGGLTFGFDKQVGESVDAEHISIQTGEGGLGMQQYMQVAFAMMLLVSALLVYFKMSRSTTLAVIGALIVMVLSQTFTKSCLLGKIVPKSVFVAK